MGYVSIKSRPKSKTLKVFQAPAILVARNGYAGTMTYIAEGMFTTNDHAYVLSIKQDWKDKINLEWFMLEHQSLFHKLVTSVSDNATFNKEYAQKQITQIPEISYQNIKVSKIKPVIVTNDKLNFFKQKVDNLLEYTIM